MNKVLRFLWILSALKRTDSTILHSSEDLETPLLSSIEVTSPSSVHQNHHIATEAIIEKAHVPADKTRLRGDFEYGFWPDPIREGSPINPSNEQPEPSLRRFGKIFRKPFSLTKVRNLLLKDPELGAYQKLAKKISSETKDTTLSLLAGDIHFLGPKLFSHAQDMFRDEAKSGGNQDLRRLSRDGLTLLQQDTLSFKERVWILGLLAHLEPQRSKVKDIEPQSGRWVGRGELELARTRGKIRSSQVESLWTESKKDPFDPAVEEILQRISLLHLEYKHHTSDEIDSATKVFQKMHNYLLKKDFPSKDNKDDMDQFNEHVKKLVMDKETPQWEKAFAYNLVNHLVKYDLDTGLARDAWIYEDFRQSLHEFMARQTCLDILKDTLTARARTLLAPFKDFQSVSRKDIFSAIQAMTFDGLEDEERIQVYRFVNAASIFVDPIKTMWYQEIKNYKILPLPLALVWKKLHPTLELDKLQILNFEYVVFFEHRGLISAAQRAALSANMRTRFFSEGRHVNSQKEVKLALRSEKGNFLKEAAALESLPWDYSISKILLGQDARQKKKLERLALDLQGEIMVHWHLNHDLSLHDLEDQMLRFEALSQIVSYRWVHEEAIDIELFNFGGLREALNYLAKQVLSKELKTSGIAPRKLRSFAGTIRWDKVAIDELGHDFRKIID